MWRRPVRLYQPNSRLGTSPHQGGRVMDSKTQPDRFVGIDVAKGHVTVHVRPDAIAFNCKTDAQGLANLLDRLRPLTPKVIVLEATGGYEAVVAAALAEADLPVAVVNPRQTGKFAGALGRLARATRSTPPTSPTSPKPSVPNHVRCQMSRRFNCGPCWRVAISSWSWRVPSSNAMIAPKLLSHGVPAPPCCAASPPRSPGSSAPSTS